MSNLQRALQQDSPPGVYQFDSEASVAYMRREAEQHGWKLFSLNGRKIKDKESFLTQVGKAADFPAYFGRNWDAFEECIDDLSWDPASGYVIVYDDPEKFMNASPQDWETAMDIFKTAAENWGKLDVPFYVLLRGDVAPEFGEL